MGTTTLVRIHRLNMAAFWKYFMCHVLLSIFIATVGNNDTDSLSVAGTIYLNNIFEHK